jgi:PTS system cellobiose-specific IIB component
MKNIVLICAAGMSTSLLVAKMQKCALEDGYECTINGYSMGESSRVIPTADVVLLGPQVRYNASRLKQQFPDKKIESIDMVLYGTMNGRAVLDHAKKVMG